MEDPFLYIKNLKEGWDSRDADPPSEELIKFAESIYSKIKDNSPSEPIIRMGRNGYISFSWITKEPRNELHLWLFEEEIQVYLKTQEHKITTFMNLDSFEEKDHLSTIIEAIKIYCEDIK